MQVCNHLKMITVVWFTSKMIRRNKITTGTSGQGYGSSKKTGSHSVVNFCLDLHFLSAREKVVWSFETGHYEPTSSTIFPLCLSLLCAAYVQKHRQEERYDTSGESAIQGQMSRIVLCCFVRMAINCLFWLTISEAPF